MKTTIKQQRSSKQISLAQTIGQLLQVSTEELNNMMFDMACQYMENLTDMPEVSREFLVEPMFWSWWLQQWALIDEAFLVQAAQSPLTLPTLRKWYTNSHNSIDTYPDAVIWEQIHDNYMKMAMEVIDKNTGK